MPLHTRGWLLLQSEGSGLGQGQRVEADCGQRVRVRRSSARRRPAVPTWALSGARAVPAAPLTEPTLEMTPSPSTDEPSGLVSFCHKGRDPDGSHAEEPGGPWWGVVSRPHRTDASPVHSGVVPRVWPLWHRVAQGRAVQTALLQGFLQAQGAAEQTQGCPWLGQGAGPQPCVRSGWSGTISSQHESICAQ